jgi:hypothetical protein
VITEPWSIIIRPARPADTDAVRSVAQRDSRAVPGGDLLIAVVNREVQAAIALDGGDVIADPFRRTEELVRMLALRRLQMQRLDPGRGVPSGSISRRGRDRRRRRRAGR